MRLAAGHLFTDADNDKASRIVTADIGALNLATNNILTFMRDNKTKLGGRYSYGSEQWLYRPDLAAKVCSWIKDEFQRLTGKTVETALPSIDDVAILDKYLGCRKYGVNSRRADEPWGVSPGTCYAYMGSLARYPGQRLLKIGFTSKDVNEYLYRLKRQYDPQLLATRPGNLVQEKKYHNRWRHLLTDGNEWFRLTSEIAGWLEAEWDLTPEFPSLIAAHVEDQK